MNISNFSLLQRRLRLLQTIASIIASIAIAANAIVNLWLHIHQAFF